MKSTYLLRDESFNDFILYLFKTDETITQRRIDKFKFELINSSTGKIKRKKLKTFSKKGEIIFSIPKSIFENYNDDVLHVSYYGNYKLKRRKNIVEFILKIEDFYEYLTGSNSSNDHKFKYLMTVKLGGERISNIYDIGCIRITDIKEEWLREPRR